MFLSLLGIQGSGKGTQARILQDKYNFKIFETGARIRKLSQEDSELGKKIKTIIDSGNLIPIEIISQILADFMKNVGMNHNVIFDGIPRNLEQKQIFEKLVKNTQVIHFNLTREKAEERILGRTMCSNCNRTFAQDYSGEECAACGGSIIRRTDDINLDSIRKRMDIFEQETMPVIYEYRGKGFAIEVDASGTLEDVSKEIAKKLDIKQ